MSGSAVAAPQMALINSALTFSPKKREAISETLFHGYPLLIERATASNSPPGGVHISGNFMCDVGPLHSNKFKKGASKLVWDIVTGDETWIYCYDPKIKQQSIVWVYRDEPKPTKVAHERISTKRTIASFFLIKLDTWRLLLWKIVVP
ncbi:hypothetical protein EVAR_42788_1 [Eumeta japonica]|uniref:Mariner Mos1 transposase n=1 Tax=Eumeta variegata TaxID=151549 RepID=A0A4C1WNA6_EUMVA|nr:hypothetical protein EVAR_42788_1 [Eumeta japonica]